MLSRRSPIGCGSTWSRWPIPFVCSVVLAAAGPSQDEATVDALAAVLAAEDARRFDAPLFRAATRHPSSVVRRHSALAMGRIGDSNALALLLELSSDPDTLVRKDAAFALGVMKSPDAVERLRTMALDPVLEGGGAGGVEAVTALTRIGGVDAATAISELLNRSIGIAATEGPSPPVVRALGDMWRLGSQAPVPLLGQFAEQAAGRHREARRLAIHSLARLRAPEGADVLLRATDDGDAETRAVAVDALTAEFADSADLDRRGVAARVRRLVTDPDPRVRVAALRALATQGGTDYVSDAADRAADTDPSVRVAALEALGFMDGPAALRALEQRVTGGTYATRRQAVISLARLGGREALDEIDTLLTDADWRERAVAAQALEWVDRVTARPRLERLLADPDGRVVALAFRSAIAGAHPNPDSLARRLVSHGDPAVRRSAVERLGIRADPGDVDLLVAVFRQATNASLRATTVMALGRIATADAAGGAIVERRFLAAFPTTDDFRILRAAEKAYPAAAARWGAPRPISTNRGIEDYRDLARGLVLPAERGVSQPGLVIETDRGNLRVDLFSAESPFTVQAFLRIVDRRGFDGTVWHHVRPYALAEADTRPNDAQSQADPSFRDEFNRRRFARGTLGLVVAPEGGGSRFFFTLVDRPDLADQYPVFGQLRDGFEILDRIMVGDRIRRVRRQ